ncbi:MAG: 16S rRNA (guanine(966)-N(2))-methyltransferase RsmD [Gammaproteobacteria bacterium]
MNQPLNKNKRQGTSTLRIIAGQWRSRRIPFASFAGVRPTSDRIRETLFNWIQPIIEGADCLDLFAGSGALSFEALSRGANRCIMIDQDIRVIQQLQQNVSLLDAGNAEIIWSDTLNYLSSPPWPFDIVFLDPPFRDNILEDCCFRLEQSRWLAPQARIYLECDKRHQLTELPESWELVHSKSAGQVAYHLAQRTT